MMNIPKKIHLLLLSSIIWMLITPTSCSILPGSFHGEVIHPVAAAPQINMTDQNGQVFDLSTMQGRLVLVFFGFTNCVEECPLTLAHLKQARELLGESSSNVQVVLVSTDPVRDTPDILRDYLNKFDPNFIGITGSVDELSRIWNDYGVIVEDGGETHSSYTYVIDQDGDLRLQFDPEMAPEDIASDLKVLFSSQ
jgi:protein SCO1